MCSSCFTRIVNKIRASAKESSCASHSNNLTPYLTSPINVISFIRSIQELQKRKSCHHYRCVIQVQNSGVIFCGERGEEVVPYFGDGGCFSWLRLGSWRGHASVADQHIDTAAFLGDLVDGGLELGFRCYVADYTVDV